VRRCGPVRGLARSGMRLRHVERGVRRVTGYAGHFGTRARSLPAARSIVRPRCVSRKRRRAKGRQGSRKQFFFEKKNQKTFI